MIKEKDKMIRSLELELSKSNDLKNEQDKGWHQLIADDLLFFSVKEKDSAQWSPDDIFLHDITSGRDVETE